MCGCAPTPATSPWRPRPRRGGPAPHPAHGPGPLEGRGRPDRRPPHDRRHGVRPAAAVHDGAGHGDRRLGGLGGRDVRHTRRGYGPDRTGRGRRSGGRAAVGNGGGEAGASGAVLRGRSPAAADRPVTSRGTGRPRTTGTLPRAPTP